VRSIAIFVSVRLSVCLSICPLAYLKKPYVQTSRTFLYILHVAMARSCSDDNAICYVLPVLWMTSCFHNGTNTDTGLESATQLIIRLDSPGGAAKLRIRGRSLLSSIALLISALATAHNKLINSQNFN